MRNNSSKRKFLILPYQNELRFNGVYSRNKLSVATVPARAAQTYAAQTKDGAYIINPDEYKSIGSHWIACCVNGSNVT